MDAHSMQISTVAGTGEFGHAGDGGQAAAACLNEPKAVALDSAGNLYIADAENHVIRKVQAESGVITTVAGRPPGATASAGPQSAPAAPVEGHGLDEDPLALGEPGTTERFTQSRDLSGTVRFVTGTARKPGRVVVDGDDAAHAALQFPSSVVVDRQGTLYIADTMNHCVRVVDTRTGGATILAGTGRAGFSGDGGPAGSAALNEPNALALDDARRILYIADQSNNRVRRVDLKTGLINTVAGTGEAAFSGDDMPAAQATLAGPSGLAVGSQGDLYIADTFNNRVRRVDAKTGLISTAAGDGGVYRYEGGEAESKSLSRPYGIAVDREDSLYITDSDSHLIRRWDRGTGRISLVAGNGTAGFAGDGAASADSCLSYPFGVAVAPDGAIYVADTFNHRIRKIVRSGG